MKPFPQFAVCCLAILSFGAASVAQQAEEHIHAPLGSEEGLGHAHMDISCSRGVGAKFDRALALLHNFWYSRALQGFHQVAKDDPQCAMAYWGAAMTYNHPRWDAPSTADESAAWDLVQKGLAAKEASPREKLYLAAVAALFKDAGAGPKATRDEGHRNAMAAAHASSPDDETKLFYGFAILGTVKEGTKGFDNQAKAAKLFEEVYAHNPDHPGVLHYLIHAYDDPLDAEQGLPAARAYGKTAPAVPTCPPHAFPHLHSFGILG
jgi:tetratricopeptide (TPR) repeat protein